MSTPRPKPCLQYVGSKMTLAERIVALLPEHTSYIEPYAGSAAVLLAKEPIGVELINDADQMLMTFYRTLRDERTRYRLIDACAFTPYARMELESAVDDPELDDVERSRRFMVRTNQRYLGAKVSGSWTATWRGASRHSNASKWNNYRTRMHMVAERLQNVQLECRDALEVLARIRTAHDPQIAVYADPPYLPETRNGAAYASDMTVTHHQDMLDDLVRIAGPVVLSGYESDLYDSMLGPDGAGWTKYQHQVKASGQPGRGRSVARTEVLWANPACRAIALPTVEEASSPVDDEALGA